MRNSFVLWLLMIALPAGCWADQWNKHFDTSGKPELHVTAGDAALRIYAESKPGIDATVKTEGISIGSSDGVQVEAHQDGNRLDLQVRLPHGHSAWHHQSVRVEIRVPEEIAGFLRTGDGPINLERVHGDVQAQTGDGPVKVEGFDGALDAETGDGPVSLQGKFRDLQVRTGDGPVDVTAVAGSRIQNSWRLHTGDGPVQIKLPVTLSADVSLHTGDGPIAMNLPLTTNGGSNKHELHGKLNGGGPELSVHTGDGPISIGRS